MVLYFVMAPQDKNVDLTSLCQNSTVRIFSNTYDIKKMRWAVQLARNYFSKCPHSLYGKTLRIGHLVTPFSMPDKKNVNGLSVSVMKILGGYFGFHPKFTLEKRGNTNKSLGIVGNVCDSCNTSFVIF